jgi:hypothetical protein
MNNYNKKSLGSKDKDIKYKQNNGVYVNVLVDFELYQTETFVT